MTIYARDTVRRTKFIIGGRVIALAVQFTLAHGGAALATKQPVPKMERQMRHLEQLDVLRGDLATEVAYWVCRNC